MMFLFAASTVKRDAADDAGDAGDAGDENIDVSVRFIKFWYFGRVFRLVFTFFLRAAEVINEMLLWAQNVFGCVLDLIFFIFSLEVNYFFVSVLRT